VQRPPTREGIAPHLERDNDVDERAVHEVFRDRRESDRPGLADNLGARSRDE
jgi:hypothetical protein